MKKHSFMLPIGCLFIFLLTFCHKEINQPDTFATEYFPNKVGDKWLYNVYDSSLKKSFDVPVNIIGITILPKGEQATIWTFQYPNKTDTAYVFQTGDTISFVPALNLNPNDYNVKKKYVIPLSVGAFWTNAFLYDTIQVLRQTKFVINEKQFDGVFSLREKGQTVNYLIYAEEYFKPNVGMLQLSRYEYDFSPPDNKVWSLKEYHLK